MYVYICFSRWLKQIQDDNRTNTASRKKNKLFVVHQAFTACCKRCFSKKMTFTPKIHKLTDRPQIKVGQQQLSWSPGSNLRGWEGPPFGELGRPPARRAAELGGPADGRLAAGDHGGAGAGETTRPGKDPKRECKKEIPKHSKQPHVFFSFCGK